MKHLRDLPSSHSPQVRSRSKVALGGAVAGCLLAFLLILFRSDRSAGASRPIPGSKGTLLPSTDPKAGGAATALHPTGTLSAPTAEEIVADKVSAFGRSRRDFIRATARRINQEIPSEVDQFFDALETGDWEEIDARFSALSQRSGQYEGSTHSPELNPYWSAILDAYGAAEQAHLWPAQQLLDYGNAILESLRPGMVYVGGTDSGRWIPTLLNETGDGDPHVILTQNALADLRYLEFLSELYQGQMNPLTAEDFQRAFQDYVTDAQQRFEHDRQFPDEPKQLRPGEDVQVTEDGRVNVGGQGAVMTINESLLEGLRAKNPDLSFALQESSPLRGTYADALPLGPLMELGAQNAENTFTAERAAESLDYWRTKSQSILDDPGAAGSDTALKSYSHDTVAAANLLAAHHFTTEAEEAYRLATHLWPGNPESVGGLADLLFQGGRKDEAHHVLHEFLQAHPDEQGNLERTSAAWRAISAASNVNP